MKPETCRMALSAATGILLAWTMPAVARQKSDVIVLLNGDRLTGEIRELEYGQLALKTDSLGTVSIEWPDVARIESRHTFSVEANDGRRYNGNLAPGSAPGRLLLRGAGDPVELAVTEVSRIGQLESALLERVEGNVSLGFDQTRSTDVSTLRFDFAAAYRSDRLLTTLDAGLKTTHTSDEGGLGQYHLTFTNEFLRPGDYYWLALGSFESNELQGVDGRLLLGAARGRYWIRRQDAELSTYLGLGFVQEWAAGAAGGGGDQSSAEGLLGLQWKVFRFRDPETSLTSRIVLLPSLTEAGRYRAKSSISLRHEIAKDFHVDLSFDSSYDSAPPTDDAALLDYTLSTSLGYKF